MPKIHPNQQSFSQGELSPLMYGRTDLEVYGAGVKKLLNMISDSRGPAVAREGLKYITEFTDTNARVEVLSRTSSSFFTLIFLHEELKVIRNIFNPVIETFATVWTRDQIDDIQIVILPDANTIYLLHPNVQTYKLEDQTEATQSQEFTSSDTFIVPAGIVEMSLCVCGAGGGGGGGNNALPTDQLGGGAGGGGSGVVKDVVITVPAETLTITIGAGGAGGTGGAPGTNGSAGGNSSVAGGYGTVTANGGGGGIRGQSGSGGLGGSGGGNGGAGGGTSTCGVVGASCSAVCSGGANSGGARGCGILDMGGSGGGGGGGFGTGGNGGTFAPDSGTGKNGGRSGGGGGGRVNFNGGTGGGGKAILFWELSSSFVLSVVTFTNPPVNWTGTNWPSAGTFYQGRLWLGGTPENPEQFLGSKSGEPENFTLLPVSAVSAISVSIENYGAIEWMEATKVLLIGTANSEYTVTAESGLITSDDIEIEQQSAYGSASIQPAKIGDQIMYVSPDFRKLRSINYEWQQNNWFSRDLTFPSEHITKGLIKDLTWCAHPNNLLWAVLQDGTLCCMSYERANNIIGWHRHDTQGNFLSGAAGFDGERDVFVVAVERTAGTINVEYLTFDYYFDSWFETSTVTPSGDLFYVEGFDHLEAMEVQILIDGAVHPTRVVGAESSEGAGDGATGRVYIDYSASNVVAGLGFDSELDTLDFDNGSETGSGAAHMKRRNKIYAKLLDSGTPLINGERGDDRTPSTPMGTPEPYISGTVEGLGLGWDRIANVNIKQDLPLPLTVLSIYGELARNKF